MIRKLLFAFVASCLTSGFHAVAGPISIGNIVVVQVNGNSEGNAPAAGLSTNAMRTFLKEFTFDGTHVQTIAFPILQSGTQKALTLTGNATSEGFLQLSSNGQYLMLGGYNTVPPSSTTAGANNRVIGRISLDGTVDTSTVLMVSGSSAGGSFRSVASDDGFNIWTDSSAAGVRYTTFGTSSAGTKLSTDLSNLRVLNIFKGQLYSSAMSGAFRGVNQVGSGLPTTSGESITLLPGFDPSTSSPQNAYDFFFANAKTLYVADERSSGGLQKWIFDGANWNLAYTLNAGLTNGSTGLRGLAGFHDGLGNVTFVATTADTTTGNKIVKITDAIGTTTLPASAFTIVATAPTNTVFRGVELIVPEPAAITAFGLALLVCAFSGRALPARRSA